MMILMMMMIVTIIIIIIIRMIPRMTTIITTVTVTVTVTTTAIMTPPPPPRTSSVVGVVVVVRGMVVGDNGPTTGFQGDTPHIPSVIMRMTTMSGGVHSRLPFHLLLPGTTVVVVVHLKDGVQPGGPTSFHGSAMRVVVNVVIILLTVILLLNVIITVPPVQYVMDDAGQSKW